MSDFFQEMSLVIRLNWTQFSDTFEVPIQFTNSTRNHCSILSAKRVIKTIFSRQKVIWSCSEKLCKRRNVFLALFLSEHPSTVLHIRTGIALARPAPEKRHSFFSTFLLCPVCYAINCAPKPELPQIVIINRRALSWNPLVLPIWRIKFHYMSVLSSVTWSSEIDIL